MFGQHAGYAASLHDAGLLLVDKFADRGVTLQSLLLRGPSRAGRLRKPSPPARKTSPLTVVFSKHLVRGGLAPDFQTTRSEEAQGAARPGLTPTASVMEPLEHSSVHTFTIDADPLTFPCKPVHRTADGTHLVVLRLRTGMPQHIVNVCCAAPAGSTKHRCLGHATGSSCLIPAPAPAEALGPVRGGGDRPREGQDPGQGGRLPKSKCASAVRERWSWYRK